jgi:hypothetical protein
VAPLQLAPLLVQPLPMIVVTLRVAKLMARMAPLAVSATYMIALPESTAHMLGWLKRAAAPTPSAHPAAPLPARVVVLLVARTIARMAWLYVSVT